MDDGWLARRPSPPLTGPTKPVANASPATAPPVPGAAQGEDDGGLAADYPGSVAELKSSALVGELQRAGRRAGRAGRHIGLAGVWACSGVSYSAWRLRKSAVLAESPSRTAPRMTALGATSARGRRRSQRREVEWRSPDSERLRAPSGTYPYASRRAQAHVGEPGRARQCQVGDTRRRASTSCQRSGVDPAAREGSSTHAGDLASPVIAGVPELRTRIQVGGSRGSDRQRSRLQADGRARARETTECLVNTRWPIRLRGRVHVGGASSACWPRLPESSSAWYPQDSSTRTAEAPALGGRSYNIVEHMLAPFAVGLEGAMLGGQRHSG
ncbi:hypothetical protein B0H10DRAFT_2439174 [Mycena sp. CBHHK59/15]|nr:hypothetical protein B0H10DRAFT_2439174 [Mycena sp. CBHHK59/15]